MKCTICSRLVKSNGKSVLLSMHFQRKFSLIFFIRRLLTLFSLFLTHRIFGTVMRVTSAAAGNIRVKFDEVTSVNCALNDLEKLEISMKDSPEQYYPETFRVGDIVDAKFKDGPKWYRGRVANVSENGNACDIMYNDGDVSVS